MPKKAKVIVRPRHVLPPVRRTECWVVKRIDPVTGKIHIFQVECLEGEFHQAYRSSGSGYEFTDDLGLGCVMRRLIRVV